MYILMTSIQYHFLLPQTTGFILIVLFPFLDQCAKLEINKKKKEPKMNFIVKNRIIRNLITLIKSTDVLAILVGCTTQIVRAEESKRRIPNMNHHSISLVQEVFNDHTIKPLIKNRLFFNNNTEDAYKHMIDATKIFWATKTSFNKYYTDNVSNWIKRDIPLKHSTPLAIQWIGHASFLIQVNGFNMLTDPLFYDLNAILYPRKTPVGIEPDNLPSIDFVLISHNHRDHLDEASMQTLKAHQPILLVPQGTKSWFISRGFKHVIEHTWWQECTFNREGRDIKCTFVPSAHWSGRTCFDAHASLWGGWLIQADKSTTYFAGDTGFNPTNFSAIAEYAKTIDCCLLPIGPCEPRSLMHHSHMSPEEAVAAFKLLNAKLFIPMHWGTFALGPDSFDTPIKLLDQAWQKMKPPLEKKRLYTIKFGERVLPMK
jgi:L-ascorbate metabolism protein UlaG (beta-lactamase superfamily)